MFNLFSYPRTRFTASHLSLLLLATSACGIGLPTEISATLTISSPANNSTVNVPAPPQAQLVPVTFVTNWTLKAMGQCTGVDHCGHVKVFVDSTSCNASGQSYNALAVSSPAQADFGKCAMATGQHIIRLELHDDNDVIVNSLIGDPVQASTTVIAQ